MLVVLVLLLFVGVVVVFVVVVKETDLRALAPAHLALRAEELARLGAEREQPPDLDLALARAQRGARRFERRARGVALALGRGELARARVARGAQLGLALLRRGNTRRGRKSANRESVRRVGFVRVVVAQR